MTHASLLSDLVDLDAALKSDSSIDLDARKQRDRRIGLTLQQHSDNPLRQLRGWLERVEIAGWKRGGPAAAQLYHVLCVVLVVAGLAAGWGLARAVLHYTGDTPINIVNAVAVLVIPQILLLLFWIFATLPRKVPLLSSVQSALRFLNPGRLVRLLVDRFARPDRRGLQVIWDSDNMLVMAPVARWLFSFWSQLFAVWFNIGVLAAVFYLISFSDLAFAWSTTLNLDPAGFHGVLVALSWPWHGLFPDAVPAPELVEMSRYYRLEEGALGNGGRPSLVAAQLGGWWPFLVAAIVCYGLMPRLLTLLIAWLRFRHHLGKALPRLPGAPELLARMNSPLISTAARGVERTLDVAAENGGDLSLTEGDRVRCSVIEWSGSIGDDEHRALFERRLRAMGVDPVDFHRAGGALSLQQDNATIAALCTDRAIGVAVVVKSWEPPLLELLDFLQSVRGRCSRKQPLIVLLWGGREGVAGHDQEAWYLTLRRLRDPDLHVEIIGSAP